jgi:excinuclease UvrABC ATPase subunit
VAGGRCEACQGDGVVKVEMHFLPDVYVPCDVCRGQRYNRETLEVQYKGKNIAQILDMTVEDAYDFLKPVPAIARKLQTLLDVGLSYIKLGQARPRCRAARRSASSWRWSCPSATPAARSTSWTSRPPACTSPTSRCC